MKLLLYMPNMVFDADKGDSVHLRELAQNLVKLGHRVDVICRLRQNEQIGVVNVRRVWSPSIKALNFLVAGIHGLFIGVVATRMAKYDLVYTRAGFSAGARILSCLAKVPYITEINGIIGDEVRISSASLAGKAFGRFNGLIEVGAYAHSLWLIAVTPQIKTVLIEQYGIDPGKVTVIPNGVDTALFKPTDTKRARTQLNFPMEEHLVTFVGRLVAWQGVEYLIKSSAHVLREFPKTKFLIVGDGPMKQELDQLAQELGVSSRIIFAGIVRYEKVSLYISASDVCVIPKVPLASGYSPLKLYEGMSCGKPVVASKLPGFEILEQNNAGILVEPENTQQLGDAIMKLLHDGKLRNQMGRNGRKYVVDNHSWASIAKRVAQVCEQAIVNTPKRKDGVVL